MCQQQLTLYSGFSRGLCFLRLAATKFQEFPSFDSYIEFKFRLELENHFE